MDSVGFDRQCQVASIIDDQEGSGICRRLSQGKGLMVGSRRRGVLVAILK
jgi:hypothetical protein